jgi:hypothetical protein
VPCTKNNQPTCTQKYISKIIKYTMEYTLYIKHRDNLSLIKPLPTGWRPRTFLPTIDTVVPILNNRSPLIQGYESTRMSPRPSLKHTTIG